MHKTLEKIFKIKTKKKNNNDNKYGVELISKS